MTQSWVLELLRPNIARLEPYRCARDDFDRGILLDANENTHGAAICDLTGSESKMELNRYPDPHQQDLKKLICALRNNEHTNIPCTQNLEPHNIYLGVGSDECIDTLIRALCAPGKEKMLICPPTYGMYTVSANINDVDVVKVPLNLTTFDLQPKVVLDTLTRDKSIKLVYICSPGNPTGKLVSLESIITILENWHGGVLAVDEAYIDFSGPSLARLVNKYPHLVVLQTLSKSFGLAGLRCGMCFASKPLANKFNAMKAPYNISTSTSKLAIRALTSESYQMMLLSLESIKKQRQYLVDELSAIKYVGDVVGGLDANFILVPILDKDTLKPSNERAKYVYSQLAEGHQIVVRYRGSEIGCEGCLRISVGTQEENIQLLDKLRLVVMS